MPEIVLVDDAVEARFNLVSEGKRFRCDFMREGPVYYPEIGKGIEVVRRATILRDLQSFVGKPLTLEHVDPRLNVADPAVFSRISHGKVDAVGFDKDTGWFFCEGDVTSAAARDPALNPSAGFRVLQTSAGGRWNNVPFERELSRLEFHHLALSRSRSRYEESEFRLNAVKTPEGKTAMKLMFWKKDPAKPDAAPAAVEHDLPAETRLNVAGKDVPLADLIASHEAEEKRKGEEAEVAARANAAAPALTDDTEVMVGGKPVKISALKASYAARENAATAAADQAAEARENAAKQARGTAAFNQLAAARGAAATSPTIAQSSGSPQEQMQRGVDRYGSGRN